LTTQHAYPRDLSRLLGLGGEWRGQKDESERRYGRSAYDDHAAFVFFWWSTAASSACR
jgi:hypothetical protein